MSYLKFLTNVYNSLATCELVTTHEVTDENLKQFKDICDLSLPKCDNEKEFETFIKASFRRSQKAFTETLPQKNGKRSYDVNHRAVILLTTPFLIVEEFDIHNLVYLKYNIKTNEYLVSIAKQKTNNNPSKFLKKKEPIKKKFTRYNGPKSSNTLLSQKLDEALMGNSDEKKVVESVETPVKLKKSWADMIDENTQGE